MCHNIDSCHFGKQVRRIMDTCDDYKEEAGHVTHPLSLELNKKGNDVTAS